MAGAASSIPKINLIKSLRCYQLEELVGSGTFSEVFKATNTETNEVLALKCFRQEMKTSLHYRTAAREIAYMKVLDHPNILPLKVYEINRNCVFIGTEFAAFGSLKTFLNIRQPLSEQVIQHVMKQIASALDYMHSLGVFHGDIKPHNILCMSLGDDGPSIKLCDFGLTEIKLKGIDLTFTSGSFFFMAPEIQFKHPVDVTCDLWSVGVLMHYMMFGRNLFNVEEKDRERHMTLMKRRTTPNYTGSERFSTECNSLVRGLLSYDKQHRPQGETLRKHPFLNLQDSNSFGGKFLVNARNHITTAFENSKNKNFGDSIVHGIQAILEIKIHHNLIDDEHLRRYLRWKWAQYEEFTVSQERALVLGPKADIDCPDEPLSDTEFRKHLISTPKLLDGFDIGCNAEMFLMEGNKAKALTLFHEALQVLLPLMKSEPRSNRKDILGKRMKKWIQDVEVLTKGQPKTDEGAVANMSGMSNGSLGLQG